MTAVGRMMQRAARRVLKGTVRDLVVRYYDAAHAGRATFGWIAGSGSASTEVYGGLVTLRNRASELVRNEPLARRAVRSWVNNAIGTGITVRSSTSDPALNKKIDDLWLRHVDTCDAEGQNDLYGLQSLACRSCVERGEVLSLSSVVSGTPGVPLQFQILEGDYLDHRKFEKLDDGRIVMGVEMNPLGRRRAYWMFQEHPGDMFFMMPHSFQSVPITADRVVHLYEKERPGQIRGVPMLHAVMIAMREVGDYREAERVRKRIEACLAAFVVGADDEDQAPLTPSAQKNNDEAIHVRDARGELMEEMSPGMIGYLRGGKDVKFTAPSQTGSYPEYMRSQQIEIAAGTDTIYELLTGDMSRANYSSIKAGMNDFRRAIETFQWNTFIPRFCIPQRQQFLNVAIAAGLLPGNTPADAIWTTPRFEAIDPQKETLADIAAMRALLISPQEAIRRRGYDPDQVLAETKIWHEKLVAAKIVSDADASQVAKPGAPAAQGPAPGEDSAGGSGGGGSSS